VSIPAPLDRDYGDPRLRVISVGVEDVHPHPKNPRVGDVDAIADSLEAHGQYRPIVVQRSTGYVLAGNHTLKGARRLRDRGQPGWDRIDAVVLNVDDVEAARIMLVDNRTADLGTYDDGVLVALLRELPDLSGTGYDEDVLAELEAALAAAEEPESRTDPDDIPDAPDLEAAVSRVGDVWLLGPHRLAVGDATDPDVVARAVADRPVDLLWTDPPYGVSYVGKTADALTITGDDVDADTLLEFLTDLFIAARRVMRPGAAFYVCSPPGDLELTFRLALREAPLPLHQVIVWRKDRFVLGRSDYHYQHEPVLYGWTSGGQPVVPPHYDPETETIMYGWREGAAHTWNGGRKQTTVWDIPRPARSGEHPTMKPVALVSRAIENSTARGALVLDSCAGSGSTLIACHRTGRTAALVELDPRYADVICRRWQEHTGDVPRRVRDGAEPEPVSFTDAPSAAA
jgi:DNA modification methylase